MADNLKIAIRLTADGSAFVGDVRLARDELGRLGAATRQTDAALDAHGRAATRAAAEAQALAMRSQALREAQSGAARSTELLTRMVAALSATLTAGKVLEYADAWTQIGNRLKLATQDAASMRSAQEQLFQAAQKAGVAVSSVVDIYARAAQSAKELGATQDQLTRFSGGVAQAVALSGSSAEAAAGALQQLGQALASGTVHAEEFNSVLDGALRIAQAVASGLDAAGGSVGRLKELINDGKVSSKQFFDAFLSQIPRIEAEFGTAVPTMATSLTKLQNATMKLIGTTNDAVGATTTLARGIEALGNNLDTVATGVLGLGGALAAVYVARGLVPAVSAAAEFVQGQVALRSALVANTGHLLQKEAALRASAAATVQATAADLAAAQAAQVRARAEREARARQFENAVQYDGALGRTERIINAERQLAAARAANEAANDRVAASTVAASTALRTQQEVMARTTLSATLLSRTGAGLSAVLGLVGGPWGAAFLTAGAAVYYLATRTTDADHAQEAYNRTLSEGRQRVQELATATRDQAAALMEKQRNELSAAQAQAARAEAELAERVKLAKDSMPDAKPAELEAALGDLPKVVEITRKSVAAATAALDGMLAVSQKTGDAVGLELASKLAKGTGAFAMLDKATSEAVKGLGLVVERGQLMTEEQATAEKQIAALNRAIEAGPGFLRTWGSSIAQVTQLIEAIRLKIDPVKSAIADMNREIGQLRMPEGAERTALTILQQINAERAKVGDKPLTTVSPEYLTLLDKAKELETQRVQAATNARTQVLDLEKRIAQAQAAGNEKRVADLTQQKAVIEMVARGVDPAVAAGKAQQDFEIAITGADAAAGEAGKGFLRAADAQTRLAMAAGLGDAAMRQAAYANKLAEEAAKGNGNVAAQAAANRREEAAAILQIRNETVRGLELETANTNRLTEAMAAGGAAVRVAQEEEYRLTLIRKLGKDATVAGTAAQKALNDAMDAYRKNRAANDNNQLQKERQGANDNLALAERELELMGQSESVRERALTTLRNQQEAARKVAELGEDGARQWLAWQEKIADTRAMVAFQKEVQQTAKSISDDLAAKMFEKGGSILDWWRNLLKRMAIEIVSTQFIMPIVTQVVGAVPGLFGIQAPAGAAGQQTQAGGGSLTSNASQLVSLGRAGYQIFTGSAGATAASTAGSFATSGVGEFFGLSTSAVGTVPEAVAGDMMLTSSGQSLVSGAGVIGAAAPYGVFGGIAGGLIGTAANSKAVGALSGAALGAGSAGLAASIWGMGAVGGPWGIAAAAIISAVMAMIGTNKKSVGPNSAGNIVLNGDGGFRTDVALADNEGDAGAMQKITDAVASAMNTVVQGLGAKLTGTDGANTGLLQYFAKDNKWYVTPQVGAAAGQRSEFTDQDQALQYYMRSTLQGLLSTGQLTGLNADAQKALWTSKATKAEDLTKDLAFATDFRDQLALLNDNLDPTNNLIKTYTESSKKLGETVKTNIIDWAEKAKELGLATQEELTPAVRKGLMAMMGLGPAVEPLRGLDAITKQATINFEAFKPALGSLGYTAAEQADILARYVEKAKKDYLDQVGFIQRQGALSIRALTDPSAAFSMTDRWKAIGLKGDEKALTGLTTAFQAIDAAATGGTLAMTSVTAALSQLDTQLQDGVLTAEQYGQAVGWLTSAWQRSTQVAVSMRQGQRAIDTAIDPTRGRDAGSVLDDAGISDATAGVADFRSQLDAFLRTAKAGGLTAADLTYTHGQLARLLSSGAITTQQYQTVVQSLTGAYTDATSAATANADAIRRGAAGIASLIDPNRKANASDLLTDAGITATGGAVSMFRTQLDSFLVSARAGTASTADLTVTYGQLERLLKAGTITADQYQSVLEGITTAWQTGKDAGQQWTQVATKAAQEVGQAWQTAANNARQAAADWTRVSDGMSRALDNLLVNKDLSNLGADAMLSATEQQFQAAAQTLMDYQTALQAGQTPSDEARKAAVDAAERLDGLGQRYLEEARAYGLGAEEYDRRLTQVQNLYGTVRDMAKSLASAETLRAQGYDKQIAWLDTINDTLNGTGADQKALLQGIKDELIAGRTPSNPTSPTTTSTGAYTAFNNQLSAMQRGLSAADAANGGRLGYADFNAIRGQYLYAERDALSTATKDELNKAYEAAKGVSALTTQIVIDQMKAKGMTVSWADQFRTMFAAFWENDTAIDQRAGSKEAARANLEYWVGVRDQLAQAIPTSELLALLGRGAEIEPKNPDTWDLRVKYWLHERGVPGFAAGGLHAGGARVVGERGAELEVTGPARYWTHDQTRDILSPKSVSVSVDMAPVVVAVGGVTSAVMDIGRLIAELSRRVANVEEAIADLSRSHGQLAVQIRKVAGR